jgi:DNA-binding response OmpR family regulator
MSKKVLVVDDDPGMQDIFRLILEHAGYEIVMLSGADAILDGSAPLPDIYVLDKQLSGVDGLEVCRYLKEQAATKDIPVIMVSATPHAAMMAAAGADDFVEKPFRRKELLAVVARHLAAAA